MNVKNRLIILVAGLSVAGAVPAQGQSPAPDPAPVLESMKALSFLEGRWEGEGWMQRGPGPKEEFAQAEIVDWRLDGGLLIIEGIGKAKTPEAKKIHHAIAVVSFDPMTQKYRFSSYVAGRPPLDVEATVGPNTLSWGLEPQPGSHVRYTATVSETTWHEIGEYSGNGKTWVTFLEMNLTRK